MASNETEVEKLRREKEELADNLLEQKLKGINGRIMSIGDTLHQRITDSEAKSDLEFKYIKEGIEQVLKITTDTLEQTRKTNGRVTEVEKHNIVQDVSIDKLTETQKLTVKNTRFVTFMHKYPKITFILLGTMYLFSIKEIRDHVFTAVENLAFVIGKTF